MNKKIVSLVFCGTLLACGVVPAIEAMEDRHVFSSGLTVDSLVFDDRFSLADSPHTHAEVPEMNIVVSNSIAAARSKSAEGSLDIRWVNHNDSASEPEFRLLFLRYEGFRNGAQQPNRIFGIEAGRSYLVKLGFTAEGAKDWVEQVREKKSISIPNVMMPGQYLADYGL